MAIAAVKSCYGHTEGAAGLTGAESLSCCQRGLKNVKMGISLQPFTHSFIKPRLMLYEKVFAIPQAWWRRRRHCSSGRSRQS